MRPLPPLPPSWSNATERVTQVAGDPTALDVHGVGGACDTTRTGLVYETDQVVVVGLLLETTAEVCIEVGVPVTVRVGLSQPLGDRLVVRLDGSEVPVG